MHHVCAGGIMLDPFAPAGRYRYVFDHVQVGVVVHDAASRVVMANETAVRIIGYALDTMIGAENTSDLWHFCREDGTDMPLAEYPAERARLSGDQVEGVVLGIDHGRDQEPTWVSVNAFPIFSPAQSLEGVITSFTEVSELKRAQRALEAALRQAALASAAKSRFLATIGHEVRTPLTAIIGMAEIMAREPLAEVQRDRLKVILEAGGTLLGLFDDVLAVAHAEAAVRLDRCSFDLAQLLERTRQDFAGAAERKGLRLELEIGALSGLHQGDPARLRQIVANLVANALKFTASGTIAIGASEDDGGVEITVSDTGPGIDPAVLPRLFGTFTQASAAIWQSHGGAGLGLAVCRHLVDAMGGTIEVESAPGAGSRFRVRLPLPRDPAKAAPAPAERALRVLAAEDNPINRAVLEAMLERLGIRATFCENGAQAVEQWRAATWDVILVDIQMPVMNGLAATRLIRLEEHHTRRTRTPILAVTANAMSDQLAEYREAGIDATIVKPIELRQLGQTIDRAVATRAAAPVAAGLSAR